jgi:hypothetical protein
MKFNWLESRAASITFFYSAIVFSSLCAFTFLLAIPEVPESLNRSPAKGLLVILFASLAIVAIPSVLIIFFGMAVFCARKDYSSIGVKALWFVLFLATGPIGTTVYYFTVYRGYIRRNRAAGRMTYV